MGRGLLGRTPAVERVLLDCQNVVARRGVVRSKAAVECRKLVLGKVRYCLRNDTQQITQAPERALRLIGEFAARREVMIWALGM